uniref:Uncharacterized protein n=1 Tax=uncultured prokaryote TaxID=198431 RepID=A0A0H5Q740_9ZZZZ|nr:hypothetical protein [uncultured prokaryote]
MALVIPPGFGNAALVFTGANGTQPYVTTIGVDLTAAGGDFVGAANQVFNAWSLSMSDETANSFVLDRVTLAVGSDGPGGSVDSDLAPEAQSRSGTYGPTAISAIARKVTNELGRSGRGRMFLVGAASEADVGADGAILSARRTALQVAMEDFRQQLITGTGGVAPELPPVLLHGPGGSAPSPITGFAISTIVGLVRGRIR